MRPAGPRCLWQPAVLPNPLRRNQRQYWAAPLVHISAPHLLSRYHPEYGTLQLRRRQQWTWGVDRQSPEYLRVSIVAVCCVVKGGVCWMARRACPSLSSQCPPRSLDVPLQGGTAETLGDGKWPLKC